MSRSTYIYVAQHSDGRIVAARTVKHEMASFLLGIGDLHSIIVTRVRDGVTTIDPIRLDPWTLQPIP